MEDLTVVNPFTLNFRKRVLGTSTIETPVVQVQHSGMELALIIVASSCIVIAWASWRATLHYRHDRDLRSMRLHLESLASGQD